MNELEGLRARVTALENLILQSVAVDTRRLDNEQKDSAGFEALLCIVREIAEHEGISQEKFQQHYDVWFRYWHDRNLQEAEDLSPRLAAEIDTRPIKDLDIPDSIPPLFGPPSPGTP